MNFIQTLFESFNKAIKQATGQIPYDIENYIIGSGSHFEIHEYISYDEALKIYENYKKDLQLGKKTQTKKIGGFIMEGWHTLESQTGITYTFMFKVDKIITHDPNKVIDEWNKKNDNRTILERP